MAELTTQEQILIELKKQNALLEEQLRPQREADLLKLTQAERRKTPAYIALEARRIALIEAKAPGYQVSKINSLMLDILNKRR